MRNVSPKPALPRIGPYELIEKVGEGGMAEVWLARRDGIGGSTKSCALKLPLERHSADERFRKMFLSEARLALKLSHGNIVSVFDAGEADGRLYMALEWIDGVDLRDFAQRIHDLPMRFSMPVVCHIIGELLHALRYAHTFAIGGKSLGIVHRDISPQNVLLSSSGEVKLSDFGIARVIGEETSQMHVKGKMRYMAPEQFQGAPEQASDLYAVGTILHELIEGRRFRDGLESREDWMRALLTGEKPSLTRGNVPAALVALHSGLLEPEPRDRIGTADAALMQLSQSNEWRNSTIELRKMYARYFNQNRRTGLTQADGMMPALPDLLAPTSNTGLDPATGAMASAGSPSPDPTQAEPDAPMFFRRGSRRGRPASAPVRTPSKSELSGAAAATPGSVGRPMPAAGSVSAPIEPSLIGGNAGTGVDPAAPLPKPAAIVAPHVVTSKYASGVAPQGFAEPGSSPHTAPRGHVGPGADVYAHTDAQHETDAGPLPARELTRPGAIGEETRPTLGPEDVTATSLTTKQNRKDRQVRSIVLGAVGIGVVVAGLGVAKFVIGPDDTDAQSDKTASVARRAAVAPTAKDEPAPAPIVLPRVQGPVIPTGPDDPVDDPTQPDPDNPGAGANGDPAGAFGAGGAAAAAEAGGEADVGPTVLVKLRLESLPKAWVRVGTREILLEPRADLQLPVGTHKVAWKTKENGKWTRAKALVLAEHKEHIVKLAPSGINYTSYDP